MAMPWRDTEMGFQRFYCLFWGFYLWILSGKLKLARAMLYVVENVFVWFCSFVNLQCNYSRMNISPPIPRIQHCCFGKSLFRVHCVFRRRDLEHSSVTSILNTLFITYRITISSFSRASVVAISVHANVIVFPFYALQEAFYRDSNTNGRSILRGR